MKIRKLIWSKDCCDRMSQHQVRTDELEDVCFGRSLTLQARTEADNPIYYTLGQTRTGRYLFCVVLQLANGDGYPIMARRMTSKERRYYQHWKQS